MRPYIARITILPRSADGPDGLAACDSLRALGFGTVRSVLLGRRIEVTLEAVDGAAAEQQARFMCQRLFADAASEDVQITVFELP